MKKSTDSRELIRLVSRISLLTQLGLSVVTPPILFVLGALWLQARFDVGDWVLLAAILLGIFSGVTSVFSFVRRETAREVRRETKERTGEKSGADAASEGKEKDGQ